MWSGSPRARGTQAPLCPPGHPGTPVAAIVLTGESISSSGQLVFMERSWRRREGKLDSRSGREEPPSDTASHGQRGMWAGARGRALGQEAGRLQASPQSQPPGLGRCGRRNWGRYGPLSSGPPGGEWEHGTGQKTFRGGFLEEPRHEQGVSSLGGSDGPGGVC